MNLHGIDLHGNCFTVATATWENGKMSDTVLATYHFPGPALNKFLEKLTPEDFILVEATTNTFWFYDQVISHVKDCLVLNVNKMQEKDFKTDKRDAQNLLELLSFHIVVHNGKYRL